MKTTSASAPEGEPEYKPNREQRRKAAKSPIPPKVNAVQAVGHAAICDALADGPLKAAGVPYVIITQSLSGEIRMRSDGGGVHGAVAMMEKAKFQLLAADMGLPRDIAALAAAMKGGGK